MRISQRARNAASPNADADAVPQRRQPSIVDLQDEARRNDRLVFGAHRLGERVHVLLVALVEAIVPVDFEACRRRRGEKNIVRAGGRDGDIDLLLQLGLADVSDGPGAGLYRPLFADLRARRIEQRAAFGGVTVEVCEFLPVLALLDQRLAGRLRDLGEAAETALHVAQPIAALGVFALVDDVDAGRALPRDHGGDVGGEASVGC